MCLHARVARSLAFLAGAWLASATSARAQDGLGQATISGTEIVAGTTRFDAGCEPVAVATLGTEVVVACTAGRVRTFRRLDGGFQLVSEREAGGDVVEMFVRGGRVWLVVAHLEARPVDGFPRTDRTEPAASVVLPSPPGPAVRAPVETSTVPPPPTTTPTTPSPPPAVAATPPPSPPPGPLTRREPAASGVVRELRGVRIIVSLGRSTGIRANDAVEMRTGEGDHASVVGRVVSVADDDAEVEIGYGEVVHVGDAAHTTTRGATRVLTAPTPPTSMLVVSGGARVFVPIEALGIGLIGELGVAWHADIPFTLRARLFPVEASAVDASRTASGSGVAFAGVMLEAMLDTQFFAIGLGLGAAQYRPPSVLGAPPPPVGARPVGFGFQPVLRVGAIDGLHVELRPLVVAVDQAFEFAGGDGALQVPVYPGWWLLGRGGGWIAGGGFGDLGVRISIAGNGGPGSILLTPSIGWCGMEIPNRGFLSGPSVGLTIETRIGL